MVVGQEEPHHDLCSGQREADLDPGALPFLGAQIEFAPGKHRPFLHGDEAKPRTGPISIEATPPILDPEPDIAVLQIECNGGFTTPRVTSHVTERLLSDPVGREGRIPPERNRLFRNVETHRQPVGALDFLGQAAQPRHQAGSLHYRRMEPMGNAAQHVGEIIEFPAERFELLEVPDRTVLRLPGHALQLRPERSDPLQHIVVHFASHPGPLRFLGLEQLAGVLTLQPEDPTLGNHQGRNEAGEDDRQRENPRDEDPPDGDAGIGHVTPRAMARKATITNTAFTS